jgi:regulator of sirC expression with transglutaminase-like and TPR domain
VYEKGRACPEDAEALTAPGDIYFELGKYKFAIAAYKKVTRSTRPDGYVSMSLV